MRDFFGPPFRPTIVDEAGECDFTIANLNLDIARIEGGILREVFAHQFANAFVRSAISLRASAAMVLGAMFGDAALPAMYR